MQSGGQYGLPDMQQFVLGRGAPHMFAHPQDLPAASQHRQHGHPLQHHRQSQQQLQHHQHHVVQQHPQPAQHPPSQLQPQQQPLILPHQHQKNQSSNQQPQHVQPLRPRSDSPEIPSPLAAPAPPSSLFKPIITARDSLVDDEGTADEGERGAGGNRWPREETISLLRIRSEMDANFRDSGLKGPLWEEVAR